MKQVYLVFPDTITMAEFILVNRISGLEADSKNITVKGVLTDEELKLAETKYQAIEVKSRIITKH